MNRTLLDEHDAVLLDLDGTVYRGGDLVEGAQEAISKVHERGLPVRYVTNNAAKMAEAVAEHLTALGLAAETVEVSTSAQAGAGMLAEVLPAAAKVLVVGSEALASEVDRVGLVPVRRHDDEPVAVVQGHSTETAWWNLAEACIALRADSLWVACNDDVTLPTEWGLLPGNGAMVAALRAATGRNPQVAGKPQRPLLDAAAASADATTPLVVGDRLNTDIAGARNAGMPVLMVLTGVSTPRELLSAPPDLRPDYVAADLRALHRSANDSAVGEQAAWKVRGDESALDLSVIGEVDVDDPYPALRTLCAARWSLGSGPVTVGAEDRQAATVLRMLDLM